MKFCLHFSAVIAALSSVASAQVNVNFHLNPPYDPVGEVAGQGGWTISDPSPTYLSYFQTVGSTNWGTLGGLYDTPADGSVTLSQAVASPFSDRSLLTNFFIQSSANVNPGFPNRDTFGFSFQGSSGNIFDLRFVPDPGDSDLMNIFWGSGGSATTNSGWSLFDDSLYSLQVDFAADGADLDFLVSLQGTNSFSFNGTLPGAGAAGWTSFDVVWELAQPGDGGSNAIVLQGFTGVPEPTSAMGSLLAGMMGVSVAARRRRRA
jgi:hypothetical protein